MIVRILDRDRELVTRLLGMSKADAMLCLIATGFFGRPIRSHRNSWPIDGFDLKANGMASLINICL
jgi:hypothetical protein